MICGMTVKELYDELGKYIEMGHADTRVIANCNFKSPWDCKKGEEIGDFCLLNLYNAYYQSGDIELEFYDRNVEE